MPWLVNIELAIARLTIKPGEGSGVHFDPILEVFVPYLVSLNYQAVVDGLSNVSREVRGSLTYLVLLEWDVCRTSQG